MVITSGVVYSSFYNKNEDLLDMDTGSLNKEAAPGQDERQGIKKKDKGKGNGFSCPAQRVKAFHFIAFHFISFICWREELYIGQIN